ncbi:MAG: hypothetical protein O2794_04090 [bacterium]|nr:hypothetical protein [bacterium]
MNKNILIWVGVIIAIIALIFGARFVLAPRNQGVSDVSDEAKHELNEENIENDAMASDESFVYPKDWDVLIDNQPELRELTRKDLLKSWDDVVVALRDNPENTEAWMDLGTIKNTFADYNGAIQVWSKAIEVDSFRTQAYINLGNTYLFQFKQYEKAERFYMDALESDISGRFGPAIYRSLADLYRYHYPGKGDDVAKILKQGLVEYKDNLDILSYLAVYYDDLDDVDNAIKYFELLVVADPDNKSVKADLERLKKERGEM